MISHLSGSKKPKKIVIKNFKERPKVPESFLEDSWGILKQAIDAVHNDKSVFQSLEELYKICENLCHQRYAGTLYSRLRMECEVSVAQIASFILQSQGNDLEFLGSICEKWKSFCQHMIMIRCIFLYLDRTFILQTAGASSLWDMGLEIFKTIVVDKPAIRTKLVNLINELINDDRAERVVDRSILKTALGMLSDIGVYQSIIEDTLFANTQNYYRVVAATKISELSVSEYLKFVEKQIAAELGRIQEYLNISSKRTIMEILERELITSNSERILKDGFSTLMNSKVFADLKRLYSLFERVHLVDFIKVSFSEYICSTGSLLVLDPSQDPNMVEELLKLKSYLDDVIAESFSSNEMFSQTLKDSFEKFINKRANKPAELIARFIDNLLRGGIKTFTEMEVERLLDKSLLLFRFIQGKDIFEAFYKNDLAKRLLFSRSASFDAEKLMLVKLKGECGSGFTSKLEGMFKDIELSRTIMSSFKESSSYASIPNELDLFVSVLTSSNWPTFPKVLALLPASMNNYLEHFQSFYLSMYKGRMLDWQHDKSTCVLKASFESNTKELVVSLFQTLVLLCFNDQDVISYKEIRSKVGMEDSELKKTLQSLACGKFRVLRKDPKGRDVEENDNFHFNAKFTASHVRIKINAIQAKEEPEESILTTEKVVQDRQYLIDAAIVRIMKTRKKLLHNSLISDLFVHLKFPVSAQDLKKRIESLIEREYLERDPENSSLYCYVA